MAVSARTLLASNGRKSNSATINVVRYNFSKRHGAHGWNKFHALVVDEGLTSKDVLLAVQRLFELTSPVLELSVVHGKKVSIINGDTPWTKETVEMLDRKTVRAYTRSRDDTKKFEKKTAAAQTVATPPPPPPKERRVSFASGDDGSSSSSKRSDVGASRSPPVRRRVSVASGEDGSSSSSKTSARSDLSAMSARVAKLEKAVSTYVAARNKSAPGGKSTRSDCGTGDDSSSADGNSSKTPRRSRKQSRTRAKAHKSRAKAHKSGNGSSAGGGSDHGGGVDGGSSTRAANPGSRGSESANAGSTRRASGSSHARGGAGPGGDSAGDTGKPGHVNAGDVVSQVSRLLANKDPRAAEIVALLLSNNKDLLVQGSLFKLGYKRLKCPGDQLHCLVESVTSSATGQSPDNTLVKSIIKGFLKPVCVMLESWSDDVLFALIRSRTDSGEVTNNTVAGAATSVEAVRKRCQALISDKVEAFDEVDAMILAAGVGANIRVLSDGAVVKMAFSIALLGPDVTLKPVGTGNRSASSGEFIPVIHTSESGGHYDALTSVVGQAKRSVDQLSPQRMTSNLIKLFKQHVEFTSKSSLPFKPPATHLLDPAYESTAPRRSRKQQNLQARKKDKAAISISSNSDSESSSSSVRSVIDYSKLSADQRKSALQKEQEKVARKDARAAKKISRRQNQLAEQRLAAAAADAADAAMMAAEAERSSREAAQLAQTREQSQPLEHLSRAAAESESKAADLKARLRAASTAAAAAEVEAATAVAAIPGGLSAAEVQRKQSLATRAAVAESALAAEYAAAAAAASAASSLHAAALAEAETESSSKNGEHGEESSADTTSLRGGGPPGIAVRVARAMSFAQRLSAKPYLFEKIFGHCFGDSYEHPPQWDVGQAPYDAAHTALQAAAAAANNSKTNSIFKAAAADISTSINRDNYNDCVISLATVTAMLNACQVTFSQKCTAALLTGDTSRFFQSSADSLSNATKIWADTKAALGAVEAVVPHGDASDAGCGLDTAASDGRDAGAAATAAAAAAAAGGEQQ